MVWLLLAACFAVQAQDSGTGPLVVDQNLTIVGRDDATIPVPPPLPPGLPALPAADAVVPPPSDLPLVNPAPAALPYPLPVPGAADVLLDAASP
jgi:hypothetical protein